MKFEIPEGLPIMTIEELRAGNGIDGNPIYFAIGSMMNPVSLTNRELFPIESKPGEILDFKIVFFG